jgi:iron complex outermembrane receptor protein
MALRIFLASLLVTFGWITPSLAQAAIKHQIDIPSQSLGSALATLAKQTRIQVVYSTELVEGKNSPALSGSVTPEQALGQLLARTGLQFEFLDAETVTLSRAGDLKPRQAVASPPSDSLSSRSFWGPFRLAQVDQGKTTSGGSVAAEKNDSSRRNEKDSKVQLEEVVVTGTNIRGTSPASPIIVFDRDAILRSGYSSTRELITSLPQNFGGGMAETTGPSPNIDAGRNVGATSTVDLRGLGAGSTLTLLNGHRLAPNGEGFAADISAIPLAAVQRVEILTDGASAIYGSDAVGGVVNFILNDEYEGAETLAQYGGATRSDTREERVAQTVGHRWGTGGLVATYEYYSRDPARAANRSFASGLPADYLLTADQHRNSGFVHWDQALGPIKLYGDVLYSDQRKQLNTQFDTRIDDHLTTLSAAFGASASLGRGWALEANGLFGRQADGQVATTTAGDAFPAHYLNRVTSLDAKADGPLVHLPGGQVRAAIGGSERHELLETQGGSPAHASRHVAAAFAEISVPLIGEANAMPGIRRLDVDVAVRWEDYSDFGTTTNPKIGLTWVPLSSLRVRGTWGTAFRAPTLTEKYGDITAALFDAPDPLSLSPTGTTLTLISLGGNRKLGPQKAKTWTFGADWTPATVSGLKLSATYFNTNYRDRIQIVDANIFNILPNEALYPTAVVRNPGGAFVGQFIGNANMFLNFSGPFNPGDVGAFVIAQPLNVAEYKVTGIDLLADYDQSTTFGYLDWSLNTAWLLSTDQQTTPTSGVVDRLNKIFYQPALRVRGGVTWTRDSLSATVMANYVRAYSNDTVTPSESIRSYKTIDLQIAYGPRQFWGTRLSVSVRNVFDERPPFVQSLTFTGGGQFNFDPANADPIGRFVSVQLTKRW